MSILYAPQTTPVLAALAAARKERQKRIGAPAPYNITRPKPKPTYAPTVVAPETPPAPRPLYRPDRRYERSWMIAICGTDALMDASIPVRTIQEAVSDHYGVTVMDIVSARRLAKIVRPRHVSMYLCNKLTARSYPQIGMMHGGRDHTVAMFAVKKIKALLERDPELVASVKTIMETLHV